LHGPVTEANASSVNDATTASETAVIGLAINRVSQFTITDLDAHGFARAGAVFAASAGTWMRGDLSANRNLGVAIEGASVTLEDVDVTSTFKGFRVDPAFGLAISGSSTVSTTNLRANDTQGPGIFQDGSRAAHANLEARRNEAGVRVQNAHGLELSGTLE